MTSHSNCPECNSEEFYTGYCWHCGYDEGPPEDTSDGIEFDEESEFDYEDSPV